jgi:L-2-hydroxyglutarate oxidase LhgO
VSPDADVVVIGGGVVGLAAAAALARNGRSVTLLERGGGLGREMTARNSEVVHAGIYYPPGSLKAVLCCEGRERLYARCERLGIPHRRIGKWIVACDEGEAERLAQLEALGRENGVPGLRRVDGRALRRAEPQVRGVAALESPQTGIVDGHTLCLSLAAELESYAGVVALRAELIGVAPRAYGYSLEVRDADGALYALDCAVVVNAAGLDAPRIAALAGLDLAARGDGLHPCKGDYFSLAAGAPIRLQRLVYPVPSGPGLGIHATLDLAGRIRFGPDAEFVDVPRYDVDPAKAGRFAAAIRRYLPELREQWLQPDYAGVRPRLAGPGEPPRDFVIAEESGAGLPGFVDLIGIESPGLTASLAIGERVAGLLVAP